MEGVEKENKDLKDKILGYRQILDDVPIDNCSTEEATIILELLHKFDKLFKLGSYKPS